MRTPEQPGFETHGQASSKRFAPDPSEDATMRRINRRFPLIVLSSLLIPFLLGLALGGGVLLAGLSALLEPADRPTESPGRATLRM